MSNTELFTLAFLTWIASMILALIFFPAGLLMWFASLWLAGVSVVRTQSTKKATNGPV